MRTIEEILQDIDKAGRHEKGVSMKNAEIQEDKKMTDFTLLNKITPSQRKSFLSKTARLYLLEVKNKIPNKERLTWYNSDLDCPEPSCTHTTYSEITNRINEITGEN